MKSNKAIKCAKWCWKSFCLVFFCRENLTRDLIVLGLLIIIFGTILSTGWYRYKKPQGASIAQTNAPESPLSEEEAVQKEEQEVLDIQSRIDTSAWTPYQNTWYGFTLKYPNDWLDPVVKRTVAGAMWEQKVQFRPRQTIEDNPFEGFDVVMYNVAKVKELSATDEFPKLQSEELKTESECALIDGHLSEFGDYPAEQIYIPTGDACFDATLFFTNTRDAYIYNLTPKLKEGAGLAGDPAHEIKSHIPEFFSVVSTFELIDIVRPKPVPPKPKITAPYPVSYKRDANGNRVCAKKNDKPHKSKKGKGKHLDMECCLDPDEYPNPWCTY